jgi:hypothetical protein
VLDYLHRVAIGSDPSPAVAGRAVIDTALSVLMGRHSHDTERALAALRADATARGIPVARVAVELIVRRIRQLTPRMVRSVVEAHGRTVNNIAGFFARTDDPDVRRPTE